MKCSNCPKNTYYLFGPGTGRCIDCKRPQVPGENLSVGERVALVVADLQAKEARAWPWRLARDSQGGIPGREW